MKRAHAPPMPLKRETIWGMAVIFTVLARSQPGMVPMTMARMIHPKLPMPGWRKVPPRASAMPIAASMLPERAVRGELSRFNPKMKRSEARR
jgi:hypothetical protein